MKNIYFNLIIALLIGIVFISITNTSYGCPQITLSIYELSTLEYPQEGEWTIRLTPNDFEMACRAGSRSGENVNYVYCNAIASKVIMDRSGNIINRIDKNIVLVYDISYFTKGEGLVDDKPIKTICK